MPRFPGLQQKGEKKVKPFFESSKSIFSTNLTKPMWSHGSKEIFYIKIWKKLFFNKKLVLEPTLGWANFIVTTNGDLLNARKVTPLGPLYKKICVKFNWYPIFVQSSIKKLNFEQKMDFFRFFSNFSGHYGIQKMKKISKFKCIHFTSSHSLTINRFWGSEWL